MTSGIYMIEHVASGRKYIGKSVDVERRLRRHFSPAEVRRSPAHIHRAIAMYGREAFSCSVVEECSDDASARHRETHWIRTLGTRTPAGFNLTDGGDGATGARFIRSPEYRAKMRAAKLGGSHSAETRAKMSAAHMGRSKSPETREKMSAYQSDRTAQHRARLGAAHLGTTHSDETRAKISATKRRMARTGS